MINNKDKRQKGCSLMLFPDDFTVIDLETTGLSPKYHEIIELSAVKCRNGKIIGKYSSLVKPERYISRQITDITGISNAMVRNAPCLGEVLPAYLDFIGDDIVVGHNVNFDINFICDKSAQLFNDSFCNDFADLLKISRKLFPDLPNYKLATLSQLFGIKHMPTHRGTDDCIAALQCFLYCRDYARDNHIDISLY